MTDHVANIRARLAPLLAEAEGALDRRASQYPALVANGRMDEATAAYEIRVWTIIVQDWRRVRTGRGDRSGEATIAEKIAVLTGTVERYNAALVKEIQGSSKAVQRDCVVGADLATLRDLHGDAVDSILDIHQRRGRIEMLRDYYQQELPGHTGLFCGIEDYLAFHQQLRADREHQKAA